MRVVFGFLWMFMAGIAAAQSPNGQFLGLEGNWVVNWTGIQEDRLTEARISIFRNRAAVCERDALDSCNYRMVVREPEEWWFSGGETANLAYGFVQKFEPSADGMSATVLHGYGIMGHWGGTEQIRVTGANSMAGQWEYRGWTGNGTWRRVVPTFTGIELTSRHAVKVTPVSANRIVATLQWNRYDWPKRVTAPGNRPRFYLKLRGNDLWGWHAAAFENSPGLYAASVGRDKDEQGEFLSVEVVIFPGYQPGTHVLHVGGQQFYIDLEIAGRPMAADLYLEAGGTTEAAPIAPLRQPRGALKETLVFQARDIGAQPITQIRTRIMAEQPLNLVQDPPACTSVSATEILCDLAPNGGLFRQELKFWGDVPTNVDARPEITAEVEGYGEAEGWVRLGRVSDTVHLRDCDGAYAAKMSAIDPEGLGNALRVLASSVAAMPGKRLYPGPEKALVINEAQTYRIRLMTDQMAANKSPDAYLKSASETGGNDLGRIYPAAKQLIQSTQCSARQADLDTLADLKQAHAGFKLRAAEIAELSSQTQIVTEAVEKIATERFKAFTGQLPSALQTILGVGGKPLPREKKEGLIVDWLDALSFRASEVVLSNAQSRAIFLIPDILAEGVAGSAAVQAAAPNFARVFGKVPGMASLMLGSVQIGVSVVDLALLTDTWTEMDELSSWVEASAYFQALNLKYIAIEAEVAALIEQLEVATGAGTCTCRQ
ncbi:hypothetical protein [Actibacterium mucosum]|nr:hypothetical protein [Actibacterium mucosum]